MRKFSVFTTGLFNGMSQQGLYGEALFTEKVSNDKTIACYLQGLSV